MKPLAEIRALKDEVEEKLLACYGVTGLDIGYKVVNGNQTDELSLRVLVEQKRDDLPSEQRVPSELNGIRTDVIERRLVLVPEEATTPEVSSKPDDGFPYLQGGAGVAGGEGSNTASGTLGAIVKARGSEALMLLTCSHVLKGLGEGTPVVWICPGAEANAPLGHISHFRSSTRPFQLELDTVGGFAALDGGQVPDAISHKLQSVCLALSPLPNLTVIESGRLWLLEDNTYRFTLMRDDIFSQILNIYRHYPNHCERDTVDCAVVELNEGSFHSEVAGVGRIRRPALATAGLHVCKYGHTTKLTHGVVDTVDLTVKIGDRLWKNQIGIKVDAAKSNQFGHRGDSGAVVLNNTQEPVGLYFARSADGTYGAANPIHDVLDALHVDIYEEQLSGLDRDIDDSIRELTSPFAWGLGGASTPLIANLIAACRDCDDC